MPVTIQSLVEQVGEAAADLQDLRALEAARVLEEHCGASRLQILVVGTTGSGRASLVDAMLQRPDLLPRSPVPKAPISVSVRYGPSETFEAIVRDGTSATLPLERLRSFLLGAEGRSGTYAGVDVQYPCERLRTCDLRIEALDSDRSPEQWRDLLAGADFTVVVLKATALLSSTEREFIRQHLTMFGLARSAIVVNQMDLVPEDERESLLDLVRAFLGPFEGQPALLDLSAVHALKDRDAAGPLQTLLDDMTERHAPLRAEALTQALLSVLQVLKEGAARQQTALSIDQQQIDDLKASIASHREWLERRVQRTQRRVDTFVGTVIKEQLLREIEGFGEVFRRRLPDEITSVDDIAAIKRHLPGYIERVWKEQLTERLIAVRSALFEEARTLNQTIERDLAELLGDRGVFLTEALRTFDPESEVVHTFVMPKRGKHRAASAAKGLSLYGFIMIGWNPVVGMLSLGSSHLVRRMFSGGIEAAEKEALIAAGIAAARDLERELRERVEGEFATLAQGLKGEVASLYTEGVARVEEILEDAAARNQEVELRRDQIAHLAHEIIPELRRSVDRLTGLDRDQGGKDPAA